MNKEKALEYALGMMGFPDLTKLEHHGDKQLCKTIEQSYNRGHSDALVEVVEQINVFNKGMSEYFMQHNYRDMWLFWQKFQEEINNKFR